MAGDDEKDEPDTGGQYTKPSQIPLLDDVVSEGKPVRRRRRKPRRENFNLHLEPEPPEIGDLFDDLEHLDDHLDAPPGDDDSGPSAETPPRPATEPTQSLRTRADAVVDRLVKEYAHDMIHRLRDELTQLLDELDERETPTPTDGEKIWDGPPLAAWHPWLPVEVARRLEGTSANWAVVGGWAVDLFLKSHSRQHEDIEIAVPRTELSLLMPHFTDCELFQVGDGEVRRMRTSDPVPEAIHQIWVVERTTGHYRLDIMFEPGDEEPTWTYVWGLGDLADVLVLSGRLDEAEDLYAEVERIAAETLRVPRAEVTTRRNNIPFLSPEIVLLFKAKTERDKDRDDFQRCLHHLTSDRRIWLRSALERFFPDCSWLGSL